MLTYYVNMGQMKNANLDCTVFMSFINGEAATDILSLVKIWSSNICAAERAAVYICQFLKVLI